MQLYLPAPLILGQLHHFGLHDARHRNEHQGAEQECYSQKTWGWFPGRVTLDHEQASQNYQERSESYAESEENPLDRTPADIVSMRLVQRRKAAIEARRVQVRSK